MDGCFKILLDEIHKYEGTINQFAGDGVMAFFGAPVAHEDYAQRACYAALSIQKALENCREDNSKIGSKRMSNENANFDSIDHNLFIKHSIGFCFSRHLHPGIQSC